MLRAQSRLVTVHIAENNPVDFASGQICQITGILQLLDGVFPQRGDIRALVPGLEAFSRVRRSLICCLRASISFSQWSPFLASFVLKQIVSQAR